jgi:hypothetical protein
MPLQITFKDGLIEDGIAAPTGTGANAVVFYDNTIGRDNVPDAFSFIAITNARVSETYVSYPITLFGMTEAATITVTGGAEYELNGSGVWATTGPITTDDVLRLRGTSPAAKGQSVSYTVTVNGVSAPWAIFSEPVPGQDNTPDFTNFTAVTGAGLTTYVVSNLQVPNGYNAPSSITAISNAEYSVNAGPWSSTLPRTIVPGESIRLRVLTGSLGNTGMTASITIGGVQRIWSVTTGPFNAPDADVTPDNFTFTDVTSADPSTTYIAQPVRIVGLGTNVFAPVTIAGTAGTNFAYSKNGGAYTTSPGTVQNGDSLRLRLNSPSGWETSVSTTITVGSFSDEWTITTRAFGTDDTYPDAYSSTWEDWEEGVPGSTVTFPTFTPTGFDSTTQINIAAGEYSINGGTFTDLPGFLDPGQTVRIRGIVPPAGKITTILLNIGGRIATQRLIAVAETDDLTPFPFFFQDVVDAQPSQMVESNAISIQDVTQPVACGIRAVDGVNQTFGNEDDAEFRIDRNDGQGWTAWFTDDVSVQDGHRVQLRLLASASGSTTRSIKFVAGEGPAADNPVATWHVTTIGTGGVDTVPAHYGFTPQTNVPLSTVVTSEAQIISGLGVSVAAPIAVTGGSYSKNGAAFTNVPGTVINGDSIRVQHTSSGTLGGGVTTTTTLNIGGIVRTFTSTTTSTVLDYVPDNFDFTDLFNVTQGATLDSNVVTFTGINTTTNAELRCNNGNAPAYYRKNGGAWVQLTKPTPTASEVTANVPIVNGDTLQLRMTVMANHGFSCSVGNPATPPSPVTRASSTWQCWPTTSTTDTTPNPFTFTDITNASQNTDYDSNEITVSGINAAATIAISGDVTGTPVGGGGSTVTVTELGKLASQASSATLSVNVPVGTQMLLVVAGAESSTLTGAAAITANGTAMTVQVDRKTLTSGVVANNGIALATMLTPPTGTVTINCTGTGWGGTNGALVAYAVNGIDTAAPIAGTGYGSNVGSADLTCAFNGTGTGAAAGQSLVTTAANAFVFAALVQGNLTETVADIAGYTTILDGYQGAGVQIDVVTDNDAGASGTNLGATQWSITSGANRATTAQIAFKPGTSSGSGTVDGYSKNDGSFTVTAGTVVNGDRIKLRMKSGTSASAVKAATLTIGGVSDTWSVTTAAPASGGTVNMPTFEDGPWKVTLPIDSSGNLSGATNGLAIEVWPNNVNGTGDLKTYVDSSIYIDRQPDNTIIFVVPTNGARTSGSSYARSELRELNAAGTNENDWQLGTGGKWEGTCAVLELPELTLGTQRRVVVAQIHGPNDELCRLYYYYNATSAQGELRFYDDKAGAGTNGTETSFTLRDASGNATQIPMGEDFDIAVEGNISGCRVTVTYNGTKYWAFSPKSNFWTSTTLMYFKCGAYGAIGYPGQGKSAEGTGQSRVRYKRILDPVHPYTATLTNAPL